MFVVREFNINVSDPSQSVQSNLNGKPTGESPELVVACSKLSQGLPYFISNNTMREYNKSSNSGSNKSKAKVRSSSPNELTTTINISFKELTKLLTERKDCSTCGYRLCFGKLTRTKLHGMKKFRMN